MNEVTKIHLGRQAFTISVDAHHELRAYIEDISEHVKDKDVVDDIELRTSELLVEHGITADKVILPRDVEYVKAQLGKPSDFIDDDTEGEAAPPEAKRLFRDTDHAMIAGVAAGLSQYFGLDVLLVRLAFVIFAFITVGWGLLLYILLWLLVPEAKTASERLRMAGKPVTVRSLKEAARQADVGGAAHRVHHALAGPINTVFTVILKLAGIVFVAFGLSALAGLVAAITYFLLRTNAWSQNNIFPVGLNEHVLLYTAFTVAGLIVTFILLVGIAIYRRKWPIKAWVSGVLAGLLLLGMSVSIALTAAVYPTVRSAYQANTHTTVRKLQPFSTISTNGNGSDTLDFVQSDTYKIALGYYGRPDLNAIKTTVNKGTLYIDTINFDVHRSCNTFCLPAYYHLHITVYAPNVTQLENSFVPPSPPVPAHFQFQVPSKMDQ